MSSERVVTYEEQIIGITKLPHYLLVKIDRFTKEGTEEEPSWQKKSCQIAYNKYLNTFPWCAEELQNSLKEGCSKRDEIFQTFEGTPEYAQFDKDYQAKNPGILCLMKVVLDWKAVMHTTKIR